MEKEDLKSKRNIVYHFFLSVFLAILVGMGCFLLTHFYPVEIPYNFIRTIVAISLILIIVLNLSFLCFLLRKDSKKEASFEKLWVIFHKQRVKGIKSKDHISRKKKIVYAFPGSFGIGYMLFFFGISETYFANVQEWLFPYRDIVLPAILFTAVFVLVLLAVFVYLLKGKYYNRGIIVLTSVFASLYLQNAFLNTTKFINGSNETVPHLILAFNVFFWAALIVIPQVFYSRIEKARKYIRNGAIALSGFILLIQIISLPYLYVSFEKKKPENYGMKTRKENVLSGEEQFTVSSEGNVIVFIMDGYQNINFEYFLKQNPSYRECFNDYKYIEC